MEIVGNVLSRVNDSDIKNGSFVIPEGIIYIEDNAFSGCESLIDIKIPESVTWIGSGAFNACKSLSKITIPEGVRHIGDGAFNDCTNLIEIVIPKSVIHIGNYEFQGCTSLTEIKIPESIIDIGNYAFYRCESLKEIIIPEGVTAIGNSTFNNCNHLTKIEIPETVTSIGDYAFKGCTNLSDLTIPRNVTKIGYEAFEDCSSLSKIEIPEGVWSIEEKTFKGCSSLIEVKIPESVEQINNNVFEDCKSLSKIKIPEGIEYIDEGTFKGCTSLSKIIIPEGIEYIDEEAFQGCTSLTEIEIPEGVKSISGNAFDKCTSLEKINIKKGNKQISEDNKYISIDGVLYYSNIDETRKTLIRYPEGKKDVSRYVLSNGTIAVLSTAFVGCNSINEIIIPKDLMNHELKVEFDYNNVEYDKDKEAIILKNGKKSRSNQYIPEAYLSYLCESNNAKSFISKADFRTFNSNIPNLKEMLSDFPEEEQLDFFKFATCLGCFSKEKILDKNLKEKETTVSQKASSLLAKLIKTPQLKIGEYHGLFDSLSFEAKASQEFLKFITPQGKKNDNLELLIRMEQNYPGIFAKVMASFEKAKEYRITLAEDGTPKVISWEEAFSRFFSSTKYVGVTEKTQDIADVYSSKGLKQNVFDKGVRLRKEAETMKIPEYILGKPIRELSILEKIEQLKQQTAEELADSEKIVSDLYSMQFTYEWLSKKDPRNGVMGLYVSCCGTITSLFYGKNIAESSITKKDVQNLVVRDSKGEIIAKGTMYIDEEQGYGLFNDFELNKKYRKNEDKSNGYGGIYDGDEKDESELSESEKKQRKERDLIFYAFQRGISAFVEEYDKQHADKPLQQINVGMGYNRLKRNVEQFEKATKLLTVPGEYRFEDAEKGQYILYRRDEREKKNINLQGKEER